MNWLQALLLGVIEGVTEFLPISSTAHLLIAERLLQLPTSTFWSFFTVFIQLGAILSVIAAFFPYLKEKRLLLLIGIGFLPTAVVGLTLYKMIKSYLFGNFTLMAVIFIAVGLLFLVLEWLVYTKRLALSRKLESLSYPHALLLGIAQACAVVPGVSRSGIVFAAGMALGYRRADMALFSFLLAVPTIAAASGYDLLKSGITLTGSEMVYVAIGFITSFVTAYIVVRWLLAFLQKNRLVGFAVYRIVLGIGILVSLYALPGVNMLK